MTTTLARPRGAATRRAAHAARVPEVDLARALAFVAAGVVLAAPLAAAPPWADDVRRLVPTVFAVVAGVAVACQRARHGGRGVPWWTLRAARRLAVLVVVGLLLAHLVPTPALPGSLAALRLADPLVALGTATVLAVPLARLATSGVLMTAVALVLAHVLLPLSTLAPAPGGRAVPAVVAALVAVLAGVALGDLLLARPRGRTTVLVLGGVGAAGWGAAVTLDALGAPVVLQHPVAAVTLVALVLAAGQAGTRWAPTDRLVAAVGQGAAVTLPLYVVLVGWHAWLADLAPLRWLAVTALGPLVGVSTASALVGAGVAAMLLRVGLVLVDRGYDLRA